MAEKATTTTSRRRILLLTNAERGQANVFLATCHSLLELGAEVHFASFKAIKAEVESSLPGAIFHELNGPDMRSAWATSGVEASAKGETGIKWTSPNLFNMGRWIRLCLLSLFPWSGIEFVEIYQSVLDVIDKLDPDMAVVDPSFSPALTAARASGQRFTILAPNTIKEFSMFAQPAFDVFCKYPCLPSGLPYPIPWYLMPLNAYYIILAITLAIFDMHRLKTEKHVKEETGAGVIGLHNLGADPPPGVKVLVANRKEIEYPLVNIPTHIIPCGPMIFPAPALEVDDADLAAWLDRGPTVYINMGTHFQTSLQGVGNMVSAIRFALDAARRTGLGRLQVLWKLRGLDFDAGSNDGALRAILGDEITKDTVRVVEWLRPQPTAVLGHPNVVVFVNHGGANSFLEGVVAGTPQVIIPAWMDCFDFANRVELLGNGVWANKRTPMQIDAGELGDALVEVLMGPRAEDMKTKARELAALCTVPGRMVAAKTILAETELQMAQAI